MIPVLSWHIWSPIRGSGMLGSSAGVPWLPPDTQGVVMTFREVLAQTVAWLQQDKRVSYRALKRQFALDDAALTELQDAVLYAYP